MKKLLLVLALFSLTFSSALLLADSPDSTFSSPLVLADSPDDAEIAAIVDQWFAQFEIAGIDAFTHSLPDCNQLNGTACSPEGAQQQCIGYNACEFGSCGCQNSAWLCIW